MGNYSGDKGGLLAGVVRFQSLQVLVVFSERELTFSFAIRYRPSICLSVCLSVENFYVIWYLGHPLTSRKNFTKIVPGEAIRRGS